MENRAGGVVAGEVASRAPPDGYTLTVQGGAFWIAPLLRKMPYDPLRDFSPISLIVREVNVLAVNPALPVRTVMELTAYAKSMPGKLNYSTTGVGSTNHLAAELFKAMAGINIVHIPYQGNQQAILALIGGEVHLAVFDASLILPHVKSGKLRALAATSAEPSELTPGLPTVAASGLPGYESIGLTGLFAAGDKTPRTIITRLNQEIVRLLNRPEIKEQLLKAGVEIVGSSPEQFADAMKSDINKMGKLIKDIGLRID